jgi:[NiFe] hydrogenase diaphorase moiety large subunit
MEKQVKKIIERYNKDKTRLMDILLGIQAEIGYISDEAIKLVSRETGLSSADVEQTMSFYHFFSKEPTGKYAIYINDSVVSDMMGRKSVVKAFEDAAGCKINNVTKDGNIGLFDTSCIGMNDQEPAALINGTVFPNLTPYRVKELVESMKAGKPVEEMFVEGYGDGNNSNENIKAIINNNIRKIGHVLDPHYMPGDVIKNKLSNMSAEDVINEIKASSIRGRGGAGFPTGLKWELCRKAGGDKKYVFCNADEGEPGTFKDRVILTERPRLLFEGMVIGAYAVGSSEGILYLRFEYKYLEKYLEGVLEDMRQQNMLGKNIAGIKGFDFDIRIQFGAGAYVCGEESALIESAEGKRGEPRDRPPFPVEKGYLDQPTIVNNVETFCATVKVLLNGADWYKSLGTNDSTGTKVLSISGDCKYPGVYEVEWGFSISDILQMVGAEDTQAVQVGGPSGSLVGPADFDRTLCYADLATGGSMIIFNKKRDLLGDVVMNFTDFFIEESCGSCSTCRIMPVIMKRKMEKILDGRGVKQDITDLKEWSKVLLASRCGLGQTASNPIVTSINNFQHLYFDRLQVDRSFDTGFDINSAIKDASEAVGRPAEATH